MVNISQRKLDYRARLERFLRTFKNILIVNVDMVGSNQMQQVRQALRGRAEVLMGKNTVIRKVLREMIPENAALEDLLPKIYGNVGFVFTNEPLLPIRNEILEYKVPAAARTGIVAPSDVVVPAGPTGLDPGQTSFFQALNIATKIVRGSIEIINPVHLIHEGERVSPSAVSLLQKLDVRPFFFGINVLYVYEDGSVYDAAVFDITEDMLLAKFLRGTTLLAALSLAIGRPNAATLPHSFARAFKKLLAIAVETDIDFEEAKSYKEFLSDPEAMAKAAAAAAAAAAAGGGGGGGGNTAAAPVEEEEEEDDDDDDDGDFSLFD